MVAVVIQHNRHVASLTVPRYDTLQAEEAAMASTVTQSSARVIIADPQQAFRNFSGGRVDRTAHQVVSQHPPDRPTTIIWASDHCPGRKRDGVMG